MAENERRMSDTESLMWRLEKDPFLASSFANITVLDRSPDMDVLYSRMERAAILFPRLRRRVQHAPGNLGNPSWVDDSDFDIRYHVRRISLPEPGTMRQLQDLTTLILADPFDRSRPLWQFHVVDGLEGGRSALIEKLHHTVTDGQGGVEMSLHFLDLERTPPPPPPLDPELVNAAMASASVDPSEALRGAMTDSMKIPLAMLRQVRDILSEPAQLAEIGSSASATVKGILTQLTETDAARSPLWTQRSIRRRLEVSRVPYREMREAARELGGKINTAFVTAAAHAAGDYHRQLGAPVESLRASMAISTRTDSSGANAFSLARMLVPTADMPIRERFAAVNEALMSARSESESASLEAIATVATILPTSVITRLARAQAQTVDFATSNVRGAGVPLYVAGAKLLANYPVGPLTGVAFNVTLMSYLGSLDVGINIDEAAVESPSLLKECLDKAFAEVCEFAPPNPGGATGVDDATGSTASKSKKIRRRWWRRSG